MQEYTHRNGESEPPTINGRYWFRGRMKYQRKSRNLLQIANVIGVLSDGTVATLFEFDNNTNAGDARGQWWGPIPEPQSAIGG